MDNSTTPDATPDDVRDPLLDLLDSMNHQVATAPAADPVARVASLWISIFRGHTNMANGLALIDDARAIMADFTEGQWAQAIVRVRTQL